MAGMYVMNMMGHGAGDVVVKPHFLETIAEQRSGGGSYGTARALSVC